MPMSCAAYIRRETLVSIAINTSLRLIFFVAVFGWGRAVPIWGLGHYVADFGPQGFMIGLMATLVPGARAARRSGTVAAWPGISRLPRSLIVRAVLTGLFGVAGGAGIAAVLFAGLGLSTIDFVPALVGKLCFGAGLAALVTPPGLHAALAE